MRCFIDIDGVLADFQGRALRWFGSPLKVTDLSWNLWQDMGLTEEQFWRKIHRSFWASLELLPGALELLYGVERQFGSDNVYLASTPTAADTGSCEGKREWVARVLPGYVGRLILARDKSALASRSALLIDDSNDNVDAFREAGGQAVLVPRPWNLLRARMTPEGDFCTEDVLDIVRYARSKLKGAT